MSALLNCLPAAQRARARLRMELSRMQARAKRMGWSQIALVASLAIMVSSHDVTHAVNFEVLLEPSQISDQCNKRHFVMTDIRCGEVGDCWHPMVT